MLDVLPQVLVSGITLGMIYGLIAFGYQLTFVTSRTVNFGQGEALAVGALIGLSLLPWLGYWAMLPAAMFFGGLYGLAVERIGVGPALEAKSEGWILTTITIGIIVKNVAENIWGNEDLPFPSPLPTTPIRFAGAFIMPTEILIVLGALLLLGLIEVLNRGTLYGRAFAATADDREAAGLVGVNTSANGAGKSTIMRAISGMIASKSGRIDLGGRKITGLKSHDIARLGIAHIPEGRRIFPSITVRDNLRLGTYTWPSHASTELEKELDEIYRLFPRLSERRNQSAGTLSGGEQQMLAIGRALMARPKVILMDEPSLGLAPKLVDEVYAIIRQLKKQGRTMVLVEQFANIALQVADFAYVLENGRVTLTGTASILMRDERVRDAYIGATAH